MRSTTPTLFVVVPLLMCAGLAQAQEVTMGTAETTYPRMVDPTLVDPNTYVFGHPASVRTHAGHANFDHPALATHAAAPEIDVNTFILRHPAGPAPAPTDRAPSLLAANR